MSMIKEMLLRENNLKDINPLISGYEDCKPNHSFGPATREYYLIHYVFSGRGIFETPRGKYEIEMGDIFIIKPFETTYYIADKKNPWVYYWVGFFAADKFKKYFSEDVMKIPQMYNIFKDIRESYFIEIGKEFYICSKIYEILAYIDSKREVNNQSKIYVEKAKNYINSNYMKEICIKELAKNLGLERSYFSKLFKKYTGISPQNYLIDFRVGKAIELMILCDYRPTEAALNVGYSDFFNFSKIFKKRIGVSPKHYKDTNKKL